MGRRRSITEEDQERFLADYEELGTIKALAEKWGIHHVTAGDTLRRLGVKTSGRSDISKGLYHPKLGVWSDARVAAEVGVSRQAVAKARRRRGLDSALERAMKIVSEG